MEDVEVSGAKTNKTARVKKKNLDVKDVEVTGAKTKKKAQVKKKA